MAETQKIEAQLAQLEETFRALIVPVLQNAAGGHDAWLFVRKKTAQEHGLDNRHSEHAEMLAEKAEKIKCLREELNLPDPTCPAALFLRACADSSDLDNARHIGPQRTAQDMLRYIR